MTRRRLRTDEAGQAAPEYLMIAGLMTAMIISVTGIIAPTVKIVVRTLVFHMAANLTSP